MNSIQVKLMKTNGSGQDQRGISMSLKKEGGCVVVEADTQMCRGLGLARQKRRKIDVK